MTNKEHKRIFLDYAAATPVLPEAHNAYTDALPYFANPQALHTEGLEAAQVRDTARTTIAKLLGVKAHELLFTSGGTESNNLALAGYLLQLEAQGIVISDCSIVTSTIEHPSVRDVFIPFEERGLKVIEVNPNEHGVVRPEDVEEAIQDNTVLVTIALVNSEIGTIQPLHAMTQKLMHRTPEVAGKKLPHIVVHTDACQGIYQSLVPQGLGVHLMSLDSGKVYGPRGAGAVYVHRDIALSPVLLGGSQENGLRPGTENVALVSGFAKAFAIMSEKRTEEYVRLDAIRTALLAGLQAHIPDLVVNGDIPKNQSPHILNISIPHIDAEYVAMYLDQRGVALSTKSACLTRSDAGTSHVVAALSTDEWRAKSMLRISFGNDTDIQDIPQVIEKIVEAVKAYKAF